MYVAVKGGEKAIANAHHLQADVGHYGVFNGRRWASEIYPLVRQVIVPGSDPVVPPAREQLAVPAPVDGVAPA